MPAFIETQFPIARLSADSGGRRSRGVYPREVQEEPGIRLRRSAQPVTVQQNTT